MTEGELLWMYTFSELLETLDKQLNVTNSEFWKWIKFRERSEHCLSRGYINKTEEPLVFWFRIILTLPPSWAPWWGSPEKPLTSWSTEESALFCISYKSTITNTGFLSTIEASRKRELHFCGTLAIWFHSEFSSGITNS